MSKIMYMFPGQGAQFVGMGKAMYDKYEKAREVFDIASKVTGLDIPALCFEENDKINITEYTQIAMLTVEAAIYAVMEEKGLKVKNFEKFPWVLPYLAVGTKEPNNWGICDLLGNGWTYLLDTVEGDHSSRRFIDAEIMADLYKDGEVDPVPYYEGVGKRIVMRGSGWGQAKFNGKAHNKVLFSSANVFHHDGHIRLVVGPDLLKERGIKLPDLGK